MSDTERLSKIKKQRNNYGSDVHRHAAVKVSDLQWLIEQAEQTESFKKLHKSYLDRYVDSVGEINRLREENYQLRIKYENTGTMMDRAALRAENRKLREALAFYADTNNYELNDGIGEWLPTIPIDKDSGDIARAALENTK